MNDLHQGCRARVALERQAMQEGLAQAVEARVPAAAQIEEEGHHERARGYQEQDQDEARHVGRTAQATIGAANAGVLTSAAAPRRRGWSPSGTVKISVSPASAISACSRSAWRTAGSISGHASTISPPT